MKFSVDRESLLKPLQQAAGVVEKRQTLPVLSNLLLHADKGRMEIIGTDLEVELAASMDIDPSVEGTITVPARKIVDICRNLPDGVDVHLDASGTKVALKSGRSRFSLAALSAEEFPRVEDIGETVEIGVREDQFRHMLERTQFAMAVQDVRYYLNGMLLEIDHNHLRTVATDGHRLAICTLEGSHSIEEKRQVIVPRKAVQELMRLLESGENELKIALSDNHVRIHIGNVQFTSKLIDGRFPDYDRVVPEKGERVMESSKESLRQALTRTSILSNEKYRGVRLTLSENQLKIQAHNPDQEEAEEELAVDYQAAGFEIGFNVNYLLDALNVIESDTLEIAFSDANSSALISGKGDDQAQHVIMPMRL